ncbi:MAG: enoyl-CoA hydratase [Gammaproteobacteria bacterium]|jgi:enoyl-CoA hydratase/carnithine racemase|nr:enoyl-CoA hydratase [Gammaproteobacteria bacterium]
MAGDPAEANGGLPLIRTDRDGITELMLNDPDRYNTLSREVIDAMLLALADIGAEKHTRVVVIAARGKAFCSGHNLKQMRTNRDQAYYERLLADCSRMMQSIVALPQPVIAKVQGIATAAGCQLVATCDLALAGAGAQFATNGINNGLFCATPAVAVSRTVARKHAMEMLLTGEFIDADRAAAIGLVNHVVADDELDGAVDALARNLAAKSQYALRLGKASFYRQLDQPLDAAYRGASNDLVCNLMSDDGIEGVDAFFEKREPQWNDE